MAAPGRLSRLSQFKEAGIILSFIVICAVTTAINPVFMSAANIIDVLRSISFTLVASVGMTFVLIGAGLDLSVGSVLGLSGMICGMGLVHGLGILPSVLLGLGAGLVTGLVNGFVIIRFKIPPLIVTLGTMNIARGVVYVISKGRPFYPFPDSFNSLGQGSLLGLPYAIYLAAATAIGAHWVLRNTVFGRSVFAVGGNEEAARVSGLPTARVKLAIYCIAALTASVAGILMDARLSSAQANAGTGWEMTVIASVIIGGTSMFGGSGSILGTAIGTAIMTVLTNAMVLMSVDPYWQKIAVGIVIILAVGIDTYRRSRLGGR
jgi:ribose/xylose/arabinose/galactoside ABC-type transport system permease subunit